MLLRKSIRNRKKPHLNVRRLNRNLLRSSHQTPPPPPKTHRRLQKVKIPSLPIYSIII